MSLLIGIKEHCIVTFDHSAQAEPIVISVPPFNRTQSGSLERRL